LRDQAVPVFLAVLDLTDGDADLACDGARGCEATSALARWGFPFDRCLRGFFT
jgi:hypothetical protein